MESKKVKFQIKSRFTTDIIFEYESDNNSLRKTVLEAVRQKIILYGANLCGADLYDADLRGANLRDADLRGADLRDANLCGANLCGADLYGANLRGADLYDANLRDANLCGADLYDADLYGANLCGANLRGCVLAYNDSSSGYGNIDSLIEGYQDNFGIELEEVYENHDSYASRWGCFWRNLIIIRKWKLKEKKPIVQLTDLQKDAIKAFAMLHGVSKLYYYEYDSYCGFSAETPDLDYDLEMSGSINGLEHKQEYTLAQLGLEN